MSNLDNKVTFENHLQAVSTSIAQKTGLHRKCPRTLSNNDSILKNFFAIILPCFEYYISAWFIAGDFHHKPSDRTQSDLKFSLGPCSSFINLF